MKWKYSRRSAKGTGSAGREASVSRLIMRHRNWAVSLAEKFGQKNNLTWLPQELVHSIPGWKFSLSLHNAILSPRMQLTLTTARSLANNFLLHRTTISSPPLFSFGHSGQGSRQPLANTAARMQMQPSQTSGARFFSYSHTARYTYQLSNGSKNTPAVVHTPHHLREKTTETSYQQVQMSHVVSTDIVSRIVEQWRRVEERSLALRSDSPPGRVELHPIRDFVLESPRPVVSQQYQGKVAADLRAGLPAPAPTSVTELADEVMRQLDRRLVATRERMGKI